MRVVRVASLLTLAGTLMSIATQIPAARDDEAAEMHSAIPKTWDDAAMATLELPLANPIGSPRHAPADYYYQIPVRPIYKSYPVYAPGHEPPGYMEWLEQQEPEIVWGIDPRTGVEHSPPLKTDADWIRAGSLVFEAPTSYSFPIVSLGDVRNPAWWAQVGARFANDGTLPGRPYVIRKKGQVDVGNLSCAYCHTRLMPDGTVISGAQGNLPVDHEVAYRFRNRPPQRMYGQYALFGAPWLNPDPQARLLKMSGAEIAAEYDSNPPGVDARGGTSIFYPAQIPDIIGVKDRHYLDHTGLQQQRSIVDLMRYAALNQGAEELASFNGFIPAGSPKFDELPNPASRTRYSDQQLYALSLYLYSLKPPHDPNKFDALAARGKKVFERQGCAGCHTPPLYTNNKLTPAQGFTPPRDAGQKYDILPISVGTDPSLALKTRRGTGYYKVPSLRGVWYRGMFGHSGWCATLEDWFDSRRTRDDYVPTGLKPYGAGRYAVKGHPFGLDLAEQDRRALIAFLKTL